MNSATAETRLIHVVDDEDAVRRSLVMDVRMPGMDGLDVHAQMIERGMNLPVVVLTGHGDITMAVRAMQAGAIDFLEKPFNRERLLQAVATAFRQLSDRGAQRERADWACAQVAAPTQREREVLNGLACGYPNKTIAYDLGISSRTVEVYRANLMTKLDVTNFADALRIAFAAGLGSDEKWRRTYMGAAQGTD